MTDTELSLFKDFFPKENKYGCYDIRINGIPVYNFIRRIVRVSYLKDQGVEYSERENVVSGVFLYRLLSIIRSFFDLIRYLFIHNEILFHTFRIENIHGWWMDRFFDPIIELGGCERTYSIIETNNGRIHKNRLHKNHILYDDFIGVLAMLNSILFYRYFVKYKFKKEFDLLDKVIVAIQPKVSSEALIYYKKVILSGLYRTNFYKFYLRRSKTKCLISASRSSFLPLLCAAKIQGIKVIELQHGIEYGETFTYSGYRDPLFTPDLFLAFGDSYPKDVYGIDESKSLTIGWALKDYIGDIVIKSDITEKDILVLSQPLSTEYIINTTLKLARKFPDNRFVIRNHPLEVLTEEQKSRIGEQHNVLIQEITDTFLIALKPFQNIIGDHSTAVYEALAYGKKVGLLAIDNHTIRMLQSDDSDCFWIITDDESFENFLKGKSEIKKMYSIYTKFNKELFKSIIL